MLRRNNSLWCLKATIIKITSYKFSCLRALTTANSKPNFNGDKILVMIKTLKYKLVCGAGRNATCKLRMSI